MLNRLISCPFGGPKQSTSLNDLDVVDPGPHLNALVRCGQWYPWLREETYHSCTKGGDVGDAEAVGGMLVGPAEVFWKAGLVAFFVDHFDDAAEGWVGAVGG